MELFEGDKVEMTNRIIQKKIKNKNQILVVLGGDGTFNLISDAALQRREVLGNITANTTPMNIMWVPCGTKNNVYRSVGGELNTPESTWEFVE